MVEYVSDVEVPAEDAHFFARDEVITFMDRIENLSQRHPTNILITGKQGCGKSSLVRQFAAYYNRPLATFQIGLLSESGQLFGEQQLRDGETCYQQFLFPKAITLPRCVIHLEELNRPEHPKALNELFSVLSEDRRIWVDQLGLVKVAKGVVFFATLNEGDEFIGAEELDAALRDRFYVIQMDYLPSNIEEKVLGLKTGVSEEQARSIIRVVNRLRGNTQMPLSVSVRHSLMIAELVSVGASIREAVIYSLQLSRDLLESLLLSVHMETGDREVRADGYRIFWRNH